MKKTNLDEFKYQDSSYICSAALDVTFYFYACVGVGMEVFHSGSTLNVRQRGTPGASAAHLGGVF